ncbi:MAG TPA: hypothetical protein VMQ48_00735 [Candidatus Saccharimonadales bacterium]|nr:hypothetical protein [Candidatus Saccharimonadales bacterium]
MGRKVRSLIVRRKRFLPGPAVKSPPGIKKHGVGHSYALVVDMTGTLLINPEITFSSAVPIRASSDDPENINNLAVFHGFAKLLLLPDPDVLAGDIVSGKAGLAKKKKGEKNRKNILHGQSSFQRYFVQANSLF